MSGCGAFQGWCVAWPDLTDLCVALGPSSKHHPEQPLETLEMEE